jgi:hypothetical protein
LQRSYQTFLEQLSSNENAARDLQINWANRHWAAEIGNIFLMLGNEEILHRLGLLAGADDVAETNRMAKMLGEILVRTASQRCWTMASWSELPPLNWSSVLSQDPEEARAGLDRIRGDQESVEAAWSYLNSGDFHEESQAGNRISVERTCKDLRRNIIYIVSGWLKICFLASSGLTTSTMISSSNFSLIGFA